MQLDDTDHQIIAYLRHQSAGIEQISGHFNEPRRTLQRRLEALNRANLIQRQGKARATVYRALEAAGLPATKKPRFSRERGFPGGHLQPGNLRRYQTA